MTSAEGAQDSPEAPQTTESPEEPEIDDNSEAIETDIDDLIEGMIDEAEDYSYGTIEDLYASADEPSDIDQYFGAEQGFKSTDEGLEGYAVVDSETVLIGEKTAEDLDSSLEDVDKALEGEESQGIWGKLKSYGSILKPEDKWDWTMYGGAALGLGGLLAGSGLALGTGLLIEGIGAGGNLYEKSSKEPEQDKETDEEDYELGKLEEIADHNIKVVDEEIYPEELK